MTSLLGAIKKEATLTVTFNMHKTIYLIFALVLLLTASPVMAQEAPDQQNSKINILPQLGVVYRNMPKADLQKAGYTENLQKACHKSRTEEWITFSDWTTERAGDTITFHIVDKKITNWDRKPGAQTPFHSQITL